VTGGEATAVGRGEATHVVAAAQDVVAQGMTLEEQVLELVEDKFGWRVLVALDLVAHHLALLLQLMLRILTAEHDVAEHVDGLSQMLACGGSMIDGVLLVGEGIELATYALEGVQNLYGGATASPLERHVLTEVGQALLALLLVARAASDGYAAEDDGRRRGQQNDAQPVLTGMCIVIGHRWFRN